MQGDLAPGVLIALFRALSAEQKTGVLHLTSGETQRKLLFQKGVIKFATTNVPSERLGDYLVRIGKLKQADLEKASKQVGRGDRLGQILIRLQMLSQEDLQRHARDHILQIIYACFGIPSGTFKYEQAEVPLPGEIKAGLSMAALIMEGVRRMDAQAAADAIGGGQLLLRPGTDPRFKSQPISLLPQEGFLLSQVDGRTRLREIVAVSPLPENETLRILLGLWCAGLIEDPSDPSSLPIHGPLPQAAAAPGPPPGNRGAAAPIHPAAASATRPAAASPASPAAPPPAAQAARPQAASAALSPAPRRTLKPGAPLSAGRRESVRPAAAPKPPANPVAERAKEVMTRFEAAKGQSFYDLLGILSSTDEADVRRAYYALAKRLHPDRFQRPEHEDVRTQAEKLFAMLTEAYNNLSDAEARQRYDQERTVPEKESPTSRAQEQKDLARKNFMHGKALITQGQFHNAITFLENAVQQDDTKAEYYQVLASLQVRNPKWRQDAERNFLRAIKIDPSLVASYISLGQMYRKMDQHERAESMFRQALSWDPEHPVAQKELAAPRAAKPSPEGKPAGVTSLLKGIFRK